MMKPTLVRIVMSRFYFVLALVMLCNLFVNILPLAAQGNAVLRITRVDTTNFPEVKVYVYTENVSPQANLTLKLTEDTVAKTVDNTSERIGTQTMLVLDASANIAEPGLTGAARKDEVANAVRRWVGKGVLSVEADWMALLTPKAGANGAVEVELGHSWNRDHNAVSNALTQFEVDPTLTLTPLFQLIFTALDSFPGVSGLIPEEQAALEKSIVVFSDGSDIVGALQRTDVANRAQNLHVRIHTVLIGPGIEETRMNMQGIADVTGGRYVHLTTVEALDDLWQTIVDRGYQRVLTYRSSQPAPRQVCVQADLGDGRLLNDCVALSIPPLPKVNVQVLSPGMGATVDRQGVAHDTALRDLEPKAVAVEVQLSWPDGTPRTVRQLEFTLNNTIQRVDVPPDAGTVEARIAISDLGEGAYTLLVRATDELGLVGEAMPVTFRIVETRPLPPPLSPQERMVRFLPAYGLQVAAVALGLAALFFALRNPRVRHVTESFTNTVRTVTEPFFLNRTKPTMTAAARAQLVLVEGEGEPVQTIKLTRSNTRLGRERSLVDTVIKNFHVSRLHCRISEEPDGSFKLWNEGSASGTYVNYEEVEFTGRVLQHGDLINLGPVQYRFEYSDNPEPDDGGMKSTQPFDPTQVFGRQAQTKTDPAQTPATNDWDPDGTKPYFKDMNATEPTKPKQDKPSR